MATGVGSRTFPSPTFKTHPHPSPLFHLSNIQDSSVLCFHFRYIKPLSMASLKAFPSSSFPLATHKPRPSKGVAAAPCPAFFPSCHGRPSRLSLVKAKATGENKDTSLDVQVKQGNMDGTTVERADF